jgi:peroxiredoxin
MKVRSVMSAVSILVLAAAIPAVAGLAIGDPAPGTDVKMKNVDGKEVTIAQMMGEKGALVVFTCNHCPWAKAWEERIVDIGNSFAAKGVGVIAVNSNDPTDYPDDGYEAMQAKSKERKMVFPYVVDSTSGVAKAFGATKTPEAFVFDSEGKLVYHGTIDDNAKEPEKVQERYLKDALEAVVSGKDVQVKETKALGCGIKFRS